MLTHILTNPLKKHAIGIIDAALAISILVILTLNKFPAFLYDLMSEYNGTLIAWIWFALFRFLTIAAFNRTPGMMILNVRFMTHDMSKPSFLEKTLASFFILVNGIRYYNTVEKMKITQHQ